MGKKIETRHIGTCELRADAGDQFAITGIAARYNKPTNIGGMFIEKIAPGAFSRSLRNKADVVCTFNHDLSAVLGRTKSGTLTLQDSPEGLKFRCQLDRDSQSHRDLYAAVKRGDLDSCSFAFLVPPNGDTWDGNKRTLTDVDLKDVSVVTTPAYPGTSVDARSRRKPEDDIDEILDGDSDDDESEDDDERCACDCEACRAGFCRACTNEDCTDEDCEECGARSATELADLRDRLAALKI